MNSRSRAEIWIFSSSLLLPLSRRRLSPHIDLLAMLCFAGWADMLIVDHYWTLLDTGQEQKISQPGSMLLSSLLSGWLWIRYSCRANEIILPVFFIYTLIRSAVDPCFDVFCIKAEVCYRTADQPCDLCCSLLCLMWLFRWSHEQIRLQLLWFNCWCAKYFHINIWAGLIDTVQKVFIRASTSLPLVIMHNT